MKAAYAGLLAVFILAGCGGGGKSSSSSTTAPTTAPVVKRATTGDVYTYLRKDTTVGGNATSYLFSRQYQVVNDDGSTIDVETFSNGLVAMVTSVSANGGITASVQKNDPATQCKFSPESIGATPPYQAGKSWDNSWTQTCGTRVSRETNKGSIVGVESVTVPAGTFNAYKEVSVITSQVTNPASEQITTNNVTCWRDVDLKQYVKCEFAASYSVPGAVSSESIATATYELQSFIASGSTKSNPSPARFAGTWAGRFYGDQLGECASLTISSAGEITGLCEDRTNGPDAIVPFPVTGTVDAQGNITFGNSAAGTQHTFSGKLRLITETDGTWTASPNKTGVWAIYHH